MRNKLLLLVFILFLGLFLSCKTDSSKAETITTEKSEPNKPKDENYPKVMTQASLDLTEYGIANSPKNVLGGLKVGDKAPDFSLYDHNGRIINLDQKLNRGPIILVFYRADWCSYCSDYLIEYKAKMVEIHNSGYASIIAVSPQKKAYSAELAKSNRLMFPILYDEGHTVMKKYKVFFHATKAYNKKVKKFAGESLEEMNGNEAVLCVPATYVIGQDFKIKYVHYDPDYSNRPDLDEVISHL